MKVLVFGKSGQVATSLQSLLDVEALGRAEADLCQPETCAECIARTQADVVINAAAYTAVDKAESEPDIAEQVNHHAVAAMGRAAAERSIPFLHISTDYVFPGTGVTPWTPEAKPSPLGVYGATKLRGEEALAAIGGQYAILRTSWVFSATGSNFVKTMLRLGRERQSLNIVADQFGGPTAAADIAATLLQMASSMTADDAISGLWHYSGAPSCSWAEFATEIFRLSGLDCKVNPISSDEYPTPAKRPLNSRLDCSSLETDFGILQPNWRASLNSVLNELGELA